MFVRLSIVLVACAVILGWLLHRNNWLECVDDYGSNTVVCRSKCSLGHFSLIGMKHCQPWLSCDDIRQIEIVKEIAGGVVKEIFLGKWRSFPVAVSKLRSAAYRADFLHGLAMLTLFQPSHLVTRLVGRCDELETFVTEFHPHSSADHLLSMLQNNDNLTHHDSRSRRLGLCINYVEILTFLHARRRVFCDSNSLIKSLQQLLVTANLNLVVNDLDALPEVNVTDGLGIKCGHREIVDDFAAPEQLWPFADRVFDDALMPAYDEKVDIWKIPDVCTHFLSDRTDCRPIVYRLFKIHNKCKEVNPSLRPTAAEVLQEYIEVAKALES